ncbi:MAG: ribonuclease III [Reyranellaceae bacterium]
MADRRRTGRRSAEAQTRLADVLAHSFRNPAILEEALMHRSAAERQRVDAVFRFGNERLEFLGDRVLSLVVADMLLTQFPSESEGELARRHAALVRAGALAVVAREIGLGQDLILGESEDATGGRDKSAILADACEAVIGALYLDGGLDAARGFIERCWQPLIAGTPKPPRDPKTELQEWAQGRGLPLPAYREVGREGPAHAPKFVIEVEVKGQAAVRGAGGNKREAERIAAQTLLETLR